MMWDGNNSPPGEEQVDILCLLFVWIQMVAMETA